MWLILKRPDISKLRPRRKRDGLAKSMRNSHHAKGIEMFDYAQIRQVRHLHDHKTDNREKRQNAVRSFRAGPKALARFRKIIGQLRNIPEAS